MNCNDVREILNQHALQSLSAAERREFDVHVAGCATCSGAVSADRLLGSEVMERPREGLLESIMAQVAETAKSPGLTPAPFRWQTIGGLVAAGVLIAVVAFSFAVRQPDTATTDPAAVTASDDRAMPNSELARPLVEGEHFTVLPVAGRLGNVGDRITAWIFFMWSCLHCYELEEILSEWVARQDPDLVDVVRIPVVWNDYAELHARAFYTASLLGMADAVSDGFFAEIHENGNYLDNRADIQSFFFDLGVDSETFAATFDSARVDELLALARFNAAEASVDSTPTIVIDGSHKMLAGGFSSNEQMLQSVDRLIAEFLEDLR